MTYTAKFHVDVEVPDSLADATVDEVREFADPLADEAASRFLDERDIADGNIVGAECALRWDEELNHVWLRYVYEVRVPKRVWQSLNPGARLDGDADG